MSRRGKNFKTAIQWLMRNLTADGFAGLSAGAKGIRGHSITEMWIDEAPSVGTIGLAPKPQPTFLARCIRQCYGKSFNDTDLEHALHSAPLQLRHHLP